MLAGADDAGLVAAVEGSAVLEDAWVDELGLAPVHAVKRYRPLADLCCRTHEKIREKLRGTDLVTLAADCPLVDHPLADEAAAAVSASSEEARCLACDDTTCAFRPLVIQRRAVGPKDILIQIKFCGVCASDLWTARSGQSVGCRTAPFVPGHEIAGVVAAVGADVEAFAVGDRVGVGCLVDSCQACGACDARDEHRCPGQVMTYASPDRHGRCGGSTPQTAGGYADRVVVQERSLALGCEVTAISSSKKAAAAKFGADRAAVLGEAAALDLVIDTVPSFAANYVDKLLGGTAPVTMSWIGGTACTRGRRPVRAEDRAEIEVVPVSELPAVLEAIDAGNDAGRRYVLDLATLPRARALRAPAFSPAGAKKYDAIGAAQLLQPFFLLYAANPRSSPASRDRVRARRALGARRRARSGE
ncbi:sinapyl alcohol dehydrogenase [Aureococcus anophagefferens]|nr:sinapyl alcohol dehydrogenase [Aureococcus anophagefferens]